jgi:hypothetical protein
MDQSPELISTGHSFAKAPDSLPIIYNNGSDILDASAVHGRGPLPSTANS